MVQENQIAPDWENNPFPILFFLNVSFSIYLFSIYYLFCILTFQQCFCYLYSLSIYLPSIYFLSTSLFSTYLVYTILNVILNVVLNVILNVEVNGTWLEVIQYWFGVITCPRKVYWWVVVSGGDRPKVYSLGPGLWTLDLLDLSLTITKIHV